MKSCTGCKADLSADAFSPDRRAVDGLQSRCRACVSLSKRAAYAADPGRLRTRQNTYYHNNKDRVSEINKASRERRKESVSTAKKAHYELAKHTPEFKARQRAYIDSTKAEKKAYDAEFRAKNAARLNEQKREWVAENKELSSEMKRSNKAKRRSAELAGDPTSEIMAWRLAATKVCSWCGMGCQDKYHVDHVMPLSRGGSHRIANLCISCPSCNLRKNAKLPEEFAKSMAERHRCDVAMLEPSRI